MSLPQLLVKIKRDDASALVDAAVKIHQASVWNTRGTINKKLGRGSARRIRHAGHRLNTMIQHIGIAQWRTPSSLKLTDLELRQCVDFVQPIFPKRLKIGGDL